MINTELFCLKHMDMFMKNLKPLVYKTHSELSQSLPSIRKSHLYEAIASFCGFKSYAAFQLANEFPVCNDELAKRKCFERMLDIGFVAGDALLISQHTEKLWAEYNNIDLDDLWHFYMNSSFEERLPSSSIVKNIKSLAQKGDREAALMGLILTTEVLAEYEDNPDNRSGEYWYKKRLANNSLNDMQAEVADNYQHAQCYRELLDFLLTGYVSAEQPVLPSPSIIKAFTNKFDDGLRIWTSFFSDDPYSVGEAFEYIQNYTDTAHAIIPRVLYLDWYKAEVVLRPNKEMIADIIESSTSDTEQWFWYYFGLNHDFDVTRDAHIAINSDTGEEWDEYGPAEVGGYTGITLPEISESSKVEMQVAVASTFS